jgi:hypothetical protein
MLPSAVDLRRALPLLLIALFGAACERSPSTSIRADAAGPRELSVRVPAGLRLARALDTLSVSIDPAALATTTVTVEPGLFLGIESQTFVYPLGGARSGEGRLGLSSGHDFLGSVDIYNARTDGLPVPGTRYVAEMTLVLFETDVPPGHLWAPHGARYRALWSRTIRQAEE